MNGHAQPADASSRAATHTSAAKVSPSSLEPAATAESPPRVLVAVCTYNRNGPLAELLSALLECARVVGPSARVGVVVVDDSRDGRARPVVDEFEGRFDLGIHYLRAGRQNISFARNMALDRATALGDWVAMTDDDCVPAPEWLKAFLEVQARTHADALSGPYHRRAPPGAPAWLTEQPFLELLAKAYEDGAPVDFAGTNNSFLRSRWWREHPEVRFALNLGVLGGEDVVFYRSAHAAGLRIHHAQRAVIFEKEPPNRATYRYQLWLFLWLGNGSYVTRRQLGDSSRARMVLQGGNHVRKALQRPLRRLWHREAPQLRYCVADTLFGVGLLLGATGVRIRHH